MTPTYSFIADLATQIPDIPSDSIISRTVYSDEVVKAVLFGFAAGQELSEHTASSPAILHFVKGEARLTLGGDSMEAVAGTWAHMSTTRSTTTSTPVLVVMLLLLLKS
ncbi:MAG: cupin domain-containing protein [Chloroflexota bacterium]